MKTGASLSCTASGNTVHQLSPCRGSGKDAMHEIVHAPFQQALKTGVIIILQACNVKKCMVISHSVVPLTARAAEQKHYEQNRTVCEYLAGYAKDQWFPRLS